MESWILSDLCICCCNVQRHRIWIDECKHLWNKVILQLPWVFVCVCINLFPGVSEEVSDGWPYMKAVLKKHCPCTGIRSNRKWAELHHLLANENKTFITLSTLAFLYLWYIPKRFPYWDKISQEERRKEGEV